VTSGTRADKKQQSGHDGSDARMWGLTT
jgi:hypothetical protein